jgi:hypothetical protein
MFLIICSCQFCIKHLAAAGSFLVVQVGFLFGWIRPNNENDKLTVLFEKMQVGQKKQY